MSSACRQHNFVRQSLRGARGQAYARCYVVRSHYIGGLIALALLSLLASWPGLGGSWVHDDLNMLGNPHYRDADDVLSVFVRHSGMYARNPSPDASAESQTYRPITMLTLVATHVLAPHPLAHHLVGWTLHALAAWLLWLALRRSDPQPAALPAQVGLAALFLLHPAGVESYVWINGRSDLTAGVCLAALLWTLASARRAGLPHALLVFVLSLLGSASKETFVPAAGLLAIAAALVPLSRELAAVSFWRRVLVEVAPMIAGVVVYACVRSFILPPTGSSIAGAGNPFASSVGWLFLPKLAAIASYALLSLRAANMQSLGWDLVRTLSGPEWLCGGVAALAVIGLCRARDVRGLVLVAAAAASLAPVVLVVFAIWLGLDRYLYQPMLLLLAAAAPYVVRGWNKLTEIMPRATALLATCVLLVAAGNTFLASRAYSDQRTWLASLAAERPEDPTVLVFLAGELGPGAASALLAQLPPPPWPSAMIVPAINLATASGRGELADRLAEYGAREYPANPLIVALAARRKYDAGEHQAALTMLSTLSPSTPICREMKRQLVFWAARADASEREDLSRAANRLRCQP